MKKAVTNLINNIIKLNTLSKQLKLLVIFFFKNHDFYYNVL